MKLKVLLPNQVYIVEEVVKVIAEGENGYFCLLPRHRDFTSTLVPGILSFSTPDGREHYVAVDIGCLVKKGDEVLVSSRNAVRGEELGMLKDEVVRRFEEIDEREKKARTAAAKLEIDLLRRFMELK